MIVYTTSLDGVTAERLHGFFQDWQNPPTAETHLRILKGSSHAVLALDDQSGNVVGFITSLTDGVLSATIPLLEVLPAYQGRGIGEQLVRRMVDCIGDLYMIEFVCEPNMQPFYTRLGMKPSSGMMKRNMKRQRGTDPQEGQSGAPPHTSALKKTG